MKQIIEDVEKMIKSDGEIKSSLIWKIDYPIAVVHKEVRIKEAELLEKFKAKNLLDEQGETPTNYTQEELDFLENEASSYIKIADYMVCNTQNDALPTFKNKRENDFWKKLEAREDYVAVVEFSFFDEGTDVCNIEAEARDIMRSRKEVHAVADLGFVWVVKTAIDVGSIFELYFKENVKVLQEGEEQYFIGWSEKLKSVDMRNFVCPPKGK